MGWFAEAEQTVIERAKASNQGITLNRTSGLTERLEMSASGTALLTNGTDGTRHLGNHISIWFRLESLATIQTIYTSYLTAANLITWVQVNNGTGDLVWYNTGSGGGTFQTVTLATGLTTGTLYHYAMINGVIYLNGVLVHTITTNSYNGGDTLVLGVRRANTALANPTTFAPAATFSYHANITFFECATWYPTAALTARAVAILYNAGKGCRLNRHIIGRRNQITGYFLFDQAFLSGSSFTNRLSSASRNLTLVQSSFQDLNYKRRAGALVY